MVKCKNPDCKNEVKYDRQNNKLHKVFCSNLCCREYYDKMTRIKRQEKKKNEPSEHT